MWRSYCCCQLWANLGLLRSSLPFQPIDIATRTCSGLVSFLNPRRLRACTYPHIGMYCIQACACFSLLCFAPVCISAPPRSHRTNTATTSRGYNVYTLCTGYPVCAVCTMCDCIPRFVLWALPCRAGACCMDIPGTLYLCQSISILSLIFPFAAPFRQCVYALRYSHR